MALVVGAIELPDTPRLAIKQQVGILTVAEVPWHNQVPVAMPSGIRLKKVDGAVVDRAEVTDVTVRIVEEQIGLLTAAEVAKNNLLYRRWQPLKIVHKIQGVLS